jgi:hypothetical protein
MTDNNNHVPGDQHLLSPWFPLIRRLRKEYNGAKVTIITARVILDEHGAPILWLEPQSSHLEPGARAEDALQDLMRGLTGAS